MKELFISWKLDGSMKEFHEQRFQNYTNTNSKTVDKVLRLGNYRNCSYHSC